MSRFPTRVLTLLVGLGLTASASAQAPNPLDLARGLRDNGLADLALEYLDDLGRKNQDPAVVALIPLERARARLELSNDEADEAKRDALIVQAKAEFSQFLKDSPSHPRRAEAAISLARLLSIEAKGMLSKSAKLDNDAERKTAAAKARPVFLDAAKRFGEAAAEFAKKADDPNLTSTQKKDVIRDVFQAELDRAINLFQLSRTYDPPNGDKEKLERAKAIDDAKKLFNELAGRDPQNRICWVARTWTGECEVAKDSPVQGKEIFEQVKQAAIKNPAANDGARLARFFELRGEFIGAMSEKNAANIKKAQAALDQWLSEPAARIPRPAPEVFAARWYSALAKDTLARSQIKVDEKTKVITVPPAALDLLKLAKRDYERVMEPENEYSGRAAEKRTQVIRIMIGDGEKDPAKIDSFEMAVMAAQVQIYKAVKESEKDQDKAKAMQKAAALYERAGKFPVPKDSAREAAEAQVNLTFSYLYGDRPLQAAVLGDYLARNLRNSGLAARAGIYGVQGYLEAAEKLNAEDAEAKKADLARALSLAAYLDQQFPADPSADVARVVLGQLNLRDGKPLEAFEVLSRVGPTSPRAANARLIEAYAAFEILRPTPAASDDGSGNDEGKKTIPVEKKAEIYRRVIADLTALPPPPAGSPADDAKRGVQLATFLAELHMTNRPAGYAKAEQAAQAAADLAMTFTELTPDQKQTLKLKADHARLRAIYGQAFPLYTEGKYAELMQKIAPPLAEVAKDGPAVKAGQAEELAEAAQNLDKFRRDELLVLAIQTRIREGAVDKIGELFDMIKKLGGSMNKSVSALASLITAVRPQVEALRKDGKNEEADKLVQGLVLVLDKVAAEKEITPNIQLFLGIGSKEVGNYDKAIEMLTKIPDPGADAMKKKSDELDKADQGKKPEEALKPKVSLYRRAQLELARTYRMAKKYTEADALLKEALGTKEKPGWAATSPDFRREAAYLLEAKGADATDPKEINKFWGEARQKWTDMAKEQQPMISKLGAGRKDPRSAVIALLDLKSLPPNKKLPEKPEDIRKGLAAPKPPAWYVDLLVENELGPDGKPVKGPDGKPVPNPEAKEYIRTLQNTIGRLESQIKPVYHDLFYEQLRCVTQANTQLFKAKPEELQTKYANIAKQIHALESANPDLNADVKAKLNSLMDEYPAIRAEFTKLGAPVAKEPPPESTNTEQNASTSPTADPSSSDSDKPKTAPPPPAKSDSTGAIIAAVVAVVISLAGLGFFLLKKKAPPPRRGPARLELSPDGPPEK